ncbi:MAG: phenylalanine--tRNA ligase subunit alpha [Bacteroidetes bacterium]|nr:phenylalanine--tRNA ligase subunit alpha [Bacteroidota bacterium]MBU1372872.1 phenylalanine--tRNA ligase subunit alpha [Bacteroidota bacterium]MBU1485601.1 phenylalanine--tRNA ligase subunit alpha [Bacteroidota bacterium]MBU1759784.1 phenylalanine--tRNA ligase subunit alpha [Bacteroidota bacterium]MBU2045455.1 phenylalanine--tRNA ligase subunit alpha [Bacteroidota bacterium]
MQSKITQYTSEIETFEPKSAEELETYRIKFLGTKGIIKDLFDEFKAVSPEEKRILGKVLNQFKQLAEAKFNDNKDKFIGESISKEAGEDLTLPGEGFEIGGRHPLSLVRKEIVEIFKRLGFVVAEGPEIEDDWHNFSALNFPEEHPARDMQDTFFVAPIPGENVDTEKKGEYALRTHTSSVQVRLMEAGKPPFRALMPGRVYRNEAISARAHCFFHQVEGLYVDENVSFADLKQTLYYFVQELYGEGTKVRFRPSYFPFTEPSAEMDISCTICGGSGCQMCKQSGWVEILGCGMIDPNVLDNVNIDSKKYTGFAFGMGIERITNLKYQIKDLRLFSENDVRFLKQFQTEVV